MIEFRADFGVEDAVRLAPCKDDKPKDAEITLFQAGSDYPLSAKGTGMRPHLKQLSEEDRGEYIDDFVKRIKEIYSVQKNGSIILKYPRLFSQPKGCRAVSFFLLTKVRIQFIILYTDYYGYIWARARNSLRFLPAEAVLCK